MENVNVWPYFLRDAWNFGGIILKNTFYIEMSVSNDKI